MQPGRRYPQSLALFLVQNFSNKDIYAEGSPWDNLSPENQFLEGSEVTLSSAYKYSLVIDENLPKNSGEGQKLVPTLLHEFTHSLGFSDFECLGNCITGRLVLPTSYSQHRTYVNDNGELVPVDGMTTDEREIVSTSLDRSLFMIRENHYSKATQELISGYRDGGLNLYADFYESSGFSDPSTGSHFSDLMQPAQLMAPAGAQVYDLGMASYVLCQLGYCGENGEVIDVAMTVNVETDSPEPDKEFWMKITFENLGDEPTGTLAADFFVDSGLDIVEVLDTDELCVLTDNAFECDTRSLLFGESHELSIKVKAAEGEYSVIGGVGAVHPSIDRKPMNNLGDTWITVKKAEAPIEQPSSSVPTSGITDDSSGGGAMSSQIGFLLLIALFRRKHIHQLN